MSDETWDAHRAVSADSGEMHFRVRDNWMVDTNTGETVYRLTGWTPAVGARTSAIRAPAERKDSHGTGLGWGQDVPHG